MGLFICFYFSIFLTCSLNICCVCVCVCVCVHAHTQLCQTLFEIPWTIAHQAPLSMGFPRQEYWSGLPFPSPGDLPDSGIKHTSLASPARTDRFLVLHIKLVFLGIYSFLNMAGSFWQSFRNSLIVIEAQWSRNWLNISLNNSHDIFLWNKMYLDLGISFLVSSSLISQLR